jgi:lactate dehydrogenase-like 2-hydroxyacid dehydrogenase
VVLVNTARGDILDVDAAVAGVHQNTLHYLGCDVFPTEPWPKMAASTHPRIVFLPHAAGFHVGLNDSVAAELENAVKAFVEGGTVPHPVGLSI